MLCPRCKVGMREERRSFHKKRKWICPRCGRTRMQTVGAKESGSPRDKRRVLE
jgi:transposase-like protein